MKEKKLLAFPNLLVLVLVLLLPAIAVANPVRPGSTAEFQAANKAHIIATWTENPLPGFAPTPAEAAKNRQASLAAWPTVLKLMPDACAKNDALACETIATSESLYSRLPDPRATRQQAAAKAASLYAQLCTANPESACLDGRDFLKKLEKADKRNPALATTVLPGGWLELGRAYENRCRSSKARIQVRDGNCENALEIYRTRAAALHRSLVEFMCNSRDDESSCQEIGTESGDRVARRQANEAQCNAGKAVFCAKVSAEWSFSTAAGFAEKSRSFARKGCDLNDQGSCMILGQSYIDSRFGTPDVQSALAAYAKACKLPTVESAKQACDVETAIRSHLSKQKSP